jgi:hypothetical protein
VHELTHGIRASLVHNYNAMYMVNNPTPYLIVTPRKPPRQRHFRSATLFGMTDSEFSAGYWVEHNMFGDVVVALYGSYCIRDPVTSKIANNPMPFQLVVFSFESLVNVETIGFQATKGHSKLRMGPCSVCLALQLGSITLVGCFPEGTLLNVSVTIEMKED